jgi:hypothetical protein
MFNFLWQVFMLESGFHLLSTLGSLTNWLKITRLTQNSLTTLIGELFIFVQYLKK